MNAVLKRIDEHEFDPKPAVEELDHLLKGAWHIVLSERPPLLTTYVTEKEKIERASCFRLGVVLYREIARRRWTPPWDRVTVDSELHLAHDGVKIEGTKAPDLVIHQRGCDDFNLLVVEAKFMADPDDKDIAKLNALVRGPRRYRHAWGVRLNEDGLLVLHRSEDYSRHG